MKNSPKSSEYKKQITIQPQKYSDTFLQKKLKELFGFNEFKGNQQSAIRSILEESRDTFIIMPTGGGKSLCYQFSALMSEGCAIILSPLIALMKNQVDLVRSYSNQESIAHFLNSTLRKAKEQEVRDDIVKGKTKILYVAPETLVKQENIDFFKSIRLSFFAIDEAHCISEWGHDFRPEYRKIREIVNEINPNIPIMALTATATPKVQQDIIKNLELKNVNVFVSSFDRSNLEYEVQPKISKEHAIKQMVKILGGGENKSSVIYVLSRKTTEEIAEVLEANNISAVAYHAGLDSKLRHERQDAFLKRKVQVIVATIAFGMGIDKPDIRYVFHYNMPKSIENYYQETGRAGRDGIHSKCILFYAHSDFLKLEYLIKQKPLMHREIMVKLVEETAFFIENGACRRKFLLNYFGEAYDKPNCGNCDNCLRPKEKVEAKAEAQLVLQTINATQQAFTGDHIINILLGNANSQIQLHNHDKSPFFGKGKYKDLLFWNSLLIQMRLEQLLKKDMVSFGVLKITPEGTAFMGKPKSFKIVLNHHYEDAADDDNTRFDDENLVDRELLEILHKLREEEARKRDLPDYIIFSENSLIDMATFYPTTVQELEKCHGVNRSKAANFGETFARAIKAYVAEKGIEKPAQDVIIKSSSGGNKLRLNIIQQIDKKIPLSNIAEFNKMSLSNLLAEIEALTLSGTKLNIDYCLDEEFSHADLEELIDYLKEHKSGDLERMQEDFENMDYTMDQLRMAKIKFINDYYF